MAAMTPPSRAFKRAGLLVAMLMALPGFATAQLGGGNYVKVSLTAPMQTAPGRPFDLIVTLDIRPGYHIQSNAAKAPYIPTRVEVTPPKGFKAGKPVFPASTTATVAGETIPVFEGKIDVKVPITPPKSTKGRPTFRVKVSYQACNESSCFPPAEVTAVSGASSASVPPTSSGPESGAANGDSAASPLPGYRMSKITQFVPPAEFVRFLETGSVPKDAGAGRLSALLSGGNLLLALPLIFLLGLALNLTPCVYPLIPITISYFGAQSSAGQRPLKLAIFYVLGMALMYSALGVAAGLTGGLFGSQLQNPWMLGLFALVMFALALSQFDRPNGLPIWEFQLPAALRHKATSRRGGLGAMLMGLMVGVVAAPCIGPAVIALLQWVGTQQSPVLGFVTFFTLALGLGLPYVALATISGSVQKLPRSGEWMVGVKHIFGVILVWMGFYYLQTVLNLLHPKLGQHVLVTVTVLGGLYLLFLDRAGARATKFFAFRRALGIAALALALWIAQPAPPETIQWQPYSDAALRQAGAEGKKVLVDFTAAWCAACKELEHNTFSNKAVGAAARDFVALRADMTNFSGPQAQEWQRQYGIQGLPTVARLVPADQTVAAR